MSNAVCFAYAPEKLPADSRLPDRAELFDILRVNDLRPFVTVGAESALVDDYVMPSSLEGDANPVTGSISRRDLGLIVNRLDRSIKHDRLTDPYIPPMINENAVRKLGYNKDRAANEILTPLGLGMPTALVNTVNDAASFTDEFEYDQYFLKPRHGSFGAKTRRLAKSAVAAYLADNPDELTKHIIQPAYDFTKPFPRSVKSLDRTTTEHFDDMNTSGQTKELRIYSFMSPGLTEIFPAARVLQTGEDNKPVSTWFYVDPESIPQTVAEQTHDVIAQTAALSGSLAVYGAVDFGYGTADQRAPTWNIIEVNLLAPGMIARKQNRYVATKLKTLLAKQIRDTIDYVAFTG